MSSTSPRHTCAKNASQHPGYILLDVQPKQRTKAQVKVDKQRTQEVQEAQEAAVQCGVSRIASMEAAMEAAQEVQATKKARPVKPQAHITKKLQDTSSTGTGTAKTGDSVSAIPSRVRAKGDRAFKLGKNSDASADVESKLAGGQESIPKARKTKKTPVMREVIKAAKDQIMRADGQAQAAALDKKGNPTESKKYNLAGKVNHWRSIIDLKGSKVNPSPVIATTSGTSQKSTTIFKSSKATSVTTTSLAKEPPLSIMNTSEASDSDNALDTNFGDDEDESQERSAALSAECKGRVTMQSVIEISEYAPMDDLTDEESQIPFADLPYHKWVKIVENALAQVIPMPESPGPAGRVSNLERVAGATKRKLDEVVSESEESDSDIQVDEDNVNYTNHDGGAMEVDEEVEVQRAVPNVKLSRSTAKTTITVSQNSKPQALKKVKLEDTRLILD
ncbi:hypothetical protein K503DRAFT_805794 [Rhizopogon vinicolor AM-OR11-026]|uniref:Uncharacterized protein n=1 Tax=Rhizopogon vinicolor AM-OR11-026 TaxID=1314800 RepID=A0A1B7MGP8_9AGAM|nr:hypothetical protein K503DRAFT_805794 [Rhizopogon vinicolor AM-OR11-026]